MVRLAGGMYAHSGSLAAIPEAPSAMRRSARLALRPRRAGVRHGAQQALPR